MATGRSMNVVEVLESFFDDDDDEIVFPGSDDESILEDINDDSDQDIEIVSLQLQNNHCKNFKTQYSK